jgi:hypothetical protein
MKESNGSIQDEAHSSFAVALVRGRKGTGDPETRVGHCGCCGEMDAPERVPSRLSLESGIPRCASAVGGCLWLVQNSRASSSVDGNGLGQKALGGKKKNQVLEDWLRVCVSCRFVREMLLRVAPRCISLACTDNKANAALLLAVAWHSGWLIGWPAGHPAQAVTCRPLRVDLPFRMSKRNCSENGNL